MYVIIILIVICTSLLLFVGNFPVQKDKMDSNTIKNDHIKYKITTIESGDPVPSPAYEQMLLAEADYPKFFGTKTDLSSFKMNKKMYVVPKNK